jgi:hypothetical protein
LKTLWILTLLVAICIAGLLTVAACGDDDDDDDNDDDDNDSDDGTQTCSDEARPLAEAYCAEFGLEAQAGAGVDYSIAECGVICSEYYYDSVCTGGLCICCI